VRNRLLVTLVLGLSAALLAGPLAPVAVAAPAAPTGLSPDGSSVSSNPVLSWTAVPKATSYRVELSRSGTFDTIDYSVSTVNRQATPTIALPSGELFWRVRSADATGAVSSWTTASFTLSPKAPPTQLTPTDGEVLSQPQEPPQLTWAPVNGATSYELAYGTDPNLSTSSAATTKTTSYAFTKPQAQATYFWKVRAVLGSGQATDWSEISSYDVEPLAQPALVGPANSPDTVVTDVVLVDPRPRRQQVRGAGEHRSELHHLGCPGDIGRDSLVPGGDAGQRPVLVAGPRVRQREPGPQLGGHQPDLAVRATLAVRSHRDGQP